MTIPVAALVALAAVAAANPAAPSAPPSPVSKPAGATSPLFPVRKDGKWGYIDRTGHVAIAPRFERAERFSEGLAAVVLDARHGYIDTTGELVLIPDQQPDGAVHRKFADGRAAVRTADGVGFIDRQGKLVIAARFTSAQDFSDGLSFACDAFGCGYVDRGGRPVVGGDLLGGKPFRDGVAGMSVRGGARHGARYVLHDVKHGRLPGDYDDVGSFSEGLVAVRHNGRWGYVDRAGKGVIRPRFSGAGEFSGGLAPVWEQVWTCGYADRAGKMVVPARFRFCYAFSSGLARVEVLGPDPKVPQPAFIDRSGAVVIEGAGATPPFTSAKDFSDGLAAVETPGTSGGTRLGYIDVGGRYVWPLTE